MLWIMTARHEAGKMCLKQKKFDIMRKLANIMFTTFYKRSSK